MKEVEELRRAREGEFSKPEVSSATDEWSSLSDVPVRSYIPSSLLLLLLMPRQRQQRVVELRERCAKFNLRLGSEPEDFLASSAGLAAGVGDAGGGWPDLGSRSVYAAGSSPAHRTRVDFRRTSSQHQQLLEPLNKFTTRF